MNKIYIFGAGNNAYGVILYVGIENVIAIIDNEEKKQGDKLLGVPIISLNEYIDRNKGEHVVISAAIYSEIVKQLEANNIYNYSIAPMLMRGMAVPSDIYEYCELIKETKIYILGSNIVEEKFNDWLSYMNYNLEVVVIDDVNNIIESELEYELKLLIFKEKLADKDKKIISQFKYVYDIYKIVSIERKKQLNKLTQYKNKYKNEKCFIICNGPSLKIADLERLYNKKIYTFGCNLIYKIYSDTYWRPNAYVISDFGLYKTYYDEIADLKKDCNDIFIKGICNIKQFKEIAGINYYYEDCRRKYNEDVVFSDDITQGVYSGYTVAYDMMQIAAYMGFSEIYLIGADFNYNGDAGQKGNHVYDSKCKDKRKLAGMTYIDCSLNAMRAAKKFAEDNEIKIYNSTRGGKLEVFERKNLDEIERF